MIFANISLSVALTFTQKSFHMHADIAVPVAAVATATVNTSPLGKINMKLEQMTGARLCFFVEKLVVIITISISIVVNNAIIIIITVLFTITALRVLVMSDFNTLTPSHPSLHHTTTPSSCFPFAFPHSKK